MAKVWNKRIFTHIKEGVDAASIELANERGPCLDAAECGINERFSEQNRHCTDRLDFHHLRWHQPRH